VVVAEAAGMGTLPATAVTAGLADFRAEAVGPVGAALERLGLEHTAGLAEMVAAACA
jgi:hypothetical protein